MANLLVYILLKKKLLTNTTAHSGFREIELRAFGNSLASKDKNSPVTKFSRTNTASGC